MARPTVFPGFDSFASASADLGHALAERRRAQGLSQQAVADLMGTSQPAVARLERGATNAQLATLIRYAEAVGAELRIELLEVEP